MKAKVEKTNVVVPASLLRLRISRVCVTAIAVVFLLALVPFPKQVAAQSRMAAKAPYASMDRGAVSYRGPGRSDANNLPGDVVKIGLLLPLEGARSDRGKLLLVAAQMAIEAENASGRLADGRKLALAVRNESERWGQASSEMVQLIDHDHVVALISSSDGNIAHQAEQIANKVGVPILMRASDVTTTQINIPWIFRMVASDEEQTRAIALNIYQERQLKRVLIITTHDHDGRVGREEFEKSARLLNAPSPELVEFPTNPTEQPAFVVRLKEDAPEAVVLWTSSETARELWPVLREVVPGVPLYACQKAIEFSIRDGAKNGVGVLVTEPRSSVQGTVREEFVQGYRQRTGELPSLAAEEIYDAVCLVAARLRTAGANRAKLRDQLAGGGPYKGISGVVQFDAAGNNLQEVILRNAHL